MNERIRGWVAGVLTREGAVVEAQENGVLYACLPAPLQERMALPEAAALRVLEPPGPDEIGVSLEGASLQACLDLALARGALAAARFDAPMKKHEHLHDAAVRVLQVDNAALRAADVQRRSLRWIVLELAYVAAADERASGSVFMAHERTLGVISAELARALLARLEGAETGDAWPGTLELEHTRRAAWPAARHELERTLVPFARGAGERLAREQRRLRNYYGKMLGEAKRRRGRAPADSDARAAKSEAIARDQERKQKELIERFAIRCEVKIASALAIEHEAALAAFVVRRKTKERVVSIAWDPWARAPIARSCEACGVVSRAFHACDDAVHLVCAACRGVRCVVCARG